MTRSPTRSRTCSRRSRARAPWRRTARRSRTVTGAPRWPMRSCGRPPAGRRRPSPTEGATNEDESRHLGAQLDGDALRAGRLPAPARGRVDGGARRARGGRARGLHRRLRVPLPAGALARQPRRRAGGARRTRHLRDRDRHAPQPALRQGRAVVAGRRGARRRAARGARRRRSGRRHRRADDPLAGCRGLQLPVPDALRGRVGAVRRRRSARSPSAAPSAA